MKKKKKKTRKKESGGGKGGVWCHHAALRLRALPGSAATETAVIYGRSKRGGEIPPVAPPLFPSLPPQNWPPETPEAGEKALFPGTSPARAGSLGPSGCRALRPTPTLPASANARDSRIPPVQGPPHPKIPLSSRTLAFCPAELWEGGDCRVCVLCFASMSITIASTGGINRFLFFLSATLCPAMCSGVCNIIL